MCTGFEIFMAAATGASALMGLANKPPKPPKIETPAIEAPPAADTNAVVRKTDTDTTDDTAPEYSPTAPQRVAGVSIGGLGKSSLGL